MELNRNVIILIIIIAIAISRYFYSVYSQKNKISKSFAEFLKRPVHKHLTKEILVSVDDTDLEQTIFDNISQLMGASEKNELHAIGKLSPGQKAVYSTWEVEAEVNNGGFNQFYFNSSRKFSEMAVDGFRLFGANKFAELIQNANVMHESAKVNLEKYNDDTTENFSKSYTNNPLNELDTLFYKLYKEEDLHQLKIKYIRSHIKEFTQD